MKPPIYPKWAGAGIAAALLAAFSLQVRAMAPGMVALRDSVKPVEQAAPGPLNPRKPWITRRSLKAGENAAPLKFEVALKMRNFGELKGRVARGERISAKEMAARYEPSAADYGAVAAWLTGQGFRVSRQDSHHMALFARGKISGIQQALGVTFARVSLGGQEYTSAITAPSVPAALSPLLLGINGLQPHIRAHKHLIRKQDLPNSLSGGASYLPKQIEQAYDATNLYSSGLNGSGEAVAIVIDTFPAASDLKTFWQDAGVAQSISNIQFIQVVSGQLADPSGEETLDTEWSSAVAPDVRVRVYATLDLEDSDLDEGYEQIYEDVTNHPDLDIHQMSMSYGEGEQDTTRSQVQTDDQYFAELAAAGVTIFASAGDDGSTPGDGYSGQSDENGPLQVESPASDPNVTGVGGTTLVLGSSNNITSEVVWNEDGGAGGGGISEYFERPEWQTGTGVVTGTNREVPDIAFAADPEYGATIVLGGEQQTVGGTSWGAPTWAGFCALINQARIGAGQKAIGSLGSSLYPLLSTPNYPSSYLADFHDITSGNNATSRSDGLYDATTGFDLCTGLGTPRLQPLAQLLAASSSLVGVQMPVAVESVTPGQTASFTVTVTGSSATYQWQRMPIGSGTWSDLGDTGAYSGATEASLTISGVTTAMSGDQFQCLVTIGSSTLTTSPASVLVVDTPLTISTLAGEAGTTGSANGAGAAAQFDYPSGVAVDGSGNVYVADFSNNQIREISAEGLTSTPYGNLEGNAGSANGSGNSASFNEPNAVAVDGSSNIYVADTGNNLIRKITAGKVSTLAGSDNQFDSPEGVAVDGSGNVYVADTSNDVIRKITAGGTVSVLAGQTGDAGYEDGAATTKALFNGPTSVAVDGSGNVYVADFGNDVVRKISGGAVSTVAGQAGQAGYLDGLALKALFDSPIGIWVDGTGDLFVADALAPSGSSTAAGNNVLREVSASGVVSTIAGEVGTTGTAEGSGTAAQFFSLQSVAGNGSGRFYLADTYNQTIRTGTSSFIPSITKIISLSGDMTFGDVLVGGSATSTLTIRNGGNTILTVTGIIYPAGFSGDWSSGSVPAGGTQTVDVTFAPVSDTGYGGNILVASDATSGSNSLAASGAGIATIPYPAVTTSAATAIGGASATLNGSANPNGASTVVYFNYGTTSSYGSVTGSSSIGTGMANVSFSAAIGGLAPAKLYHFQAVASNGGGTVTGSDQTFMTLPFATTPIVTTGTGSPVPGVAGSEFSALGNPAINNLDDLAFQATLAKGIGGVTAADNAGIWAESGSGDWQLIARTGGAAPGTNGALFSSLSNPVYNNHDAVAFLGVLKAAAGEAAAGNATGLWSNSGGTLSLVAREGSQAPGYSAGVKFSSFKSFGLPDQGGVLLLATVSNGQRGIWAGDSAADLQLIVKQGETFNGSAITGLTFLPTLSFVNGQTRSFVQGTGNIVFAATFGNKSSGIIEATGTALQSVIQSRNSAPGAPGAEFSAFGSPAVNASGFIALRSTLLTGSGGVGASNDSGIWADDDTGALQLIARTGSGAPGASGTFATLSDPVYNDNEAVAFRGTLANAAGKITGANNIGIWSNSGGTLSLAARRGAQAPGCPAGATFSAFPSLALPDQGGVIVLATLNLSHAAGVTSSNNEGIWAVDTAGNLQLIVRKGDTVNGKTISSLSLLPILSYVGGQSRNFSQATGDLVYEATFTDKTTGISVVTFP